MATWKLFKDGELINENSSGLFDFPKNTGKTEVSYIVEYIDNEGNISEQVCTVLTGTTCRPIIDGHEYVDLGLPSGTKWATMNIGASVEAQIGNYYQYGKGSAQYAATSGQSDYSGTENPLSMSVDSARQVWGGRWHTPTKTQVEELIANTSHQYTENFECTGVSGVIRTASNGNYIFLPACGQYLSGSLDFTSLALLWTSTPNTYNGNKTAYFIDGSTTDIRVRGDLGRSYGRPIRPVVG